jgi:hypothetical protein
MASNLPPGTHFMKGGVRAQVDDLFHKYDQPIMVLVGLCMTIVVVFLDKIPVDIRKQADTLLGRALLIVYTTVVTMLFGWPLGILSALMSALLIGAGGVHPIKKLIKEGFASEMNVKIVPDGKKRWFIERALGENPTIIEDERVDTSAVQDSSEKNTGSVQSSGVTR